MKKHAHDWSKQAKRIYDYVTAKPGVDIAAPILNQVAAGDGLYVASFSKRISEVRQRLRQESCDLILSNDIWANGHRHTFYRMIFL